LPSSKNQKDRAFQYGRGCGLAFEQLPNSAATKGRCEVKETFDSGIRSELPEWQRFMSNRSATRRDTRMRNSFAGLADPERSLAPEPKQPFQDATDALIRRTITEARSWLGIQNAALRYPIGSYTFHKLMKAARDRRAREERRTQ
jgi:hypothetical protein